MESDVNNSNSDSKTSNARPIKFPVRTSSEKHLYKRHSWLLPEGPTVTENQRQLRGKRTRLFSDHSTFRAPQISLYIDLFDLLKYLFCLTIEQFEESSYKASTPETQQGYNTIKGLIQKKAKKINDLQEFYLHQQHMREGATNLINSLESLKPLNKSAKQRLEECRQQREKNIERLLAIEDQFNEMAGSFKFQILGLVGFSRVCPGDTYEVTFKLAAQKWKSKCKIEALGQTWIDPEFCFQAKAAYDMNVKMVEIGKLGKTIVIGSVGCSIQEFLLSEPQVYLLPINSTGTLKLKLGVVWSPLGGSDHREIPSNEKQALFASIDFSKSNVINLRNTPGPHYITPPASRPNSNLFSSVSSEALSQSLPTSAFKSGRYSDMNGKSHPQQQMYNYNPQFKRVDLNRPSLEFRGNYHTRQGSAESYLSNQHQVGFARSSMNQHRRTSTERSPMNEMMNELKRKASISTKYPSNGDVRSQSESRNSSFSESGYHSNREETSPSYMHDFISPLSSSSSSPTAKLSNSNYTTSFRDPAPQEVPVNNITRLKIAPLSPNSSSSYVTSHETTSTSYASSSSVSHDASYNLSRSTHGMSGHIQNPSVVSNLVTNLKNSSTTSQDWPYRVNHVTTNSNGVSTSTGDHPFGWTTVSNQEEISTSPSKSTQHTYKYFDQQSSAINTNDLKLLKYTHVDGVTKSRPPPVKAKPIRRSSSLGSIHEEDLRDGFTSSRKMIELCDKIIQKLHTKTGLSMKILNLERELVNVKHSLEQFHTKQQRRSSLTESVSSALDSFAFLKDDDERSISPHANGSNKSNTIFILPKQWKQSHRALHHHLYMLYDAVSLYMPGNGPLTDQENNLCQCIHKQKFFIKEIMELISTPDEIELYRVCKQCTDSGTLTNTWEVSAVTEQPLYCTSDAMYQTVSALYQYLEIENGSDGTTVTDVELKERVCLKAIRDLTEAKIYYTDVNVLTLFQFADFFKTKVKSHSVIGFLKCIRNEELALRGLKSKNDHVVMTTIQQYWNIPVAASCIHRLLCLIANSKSPSQSAALNAVTQLYAGEAKQLLINLLYAALEEKDVQLRAGACIALGRCKVHTSSQKLIHLFNNDVSFVKEAAEAALDELGRAYLKK